MRRRIRKAVMPKNKQTKVVKEVRE